MVEIAENIKGVTTYLHSKRSFRITEFSLHIDQIGRILFGPSVSQSYFHASFNNVRFFLKNFLKTHFSLRRDAKEKIYICALWMKKM